MANDNVDMAVSPHSDDAECAVLGTFYLNNGALDEVRGILKPEDFFSHRNQEIYQAMLSLADDDSPIDPTLVWDVLTRWDSVEECGGIEYIAGLEQYVICPGNVLFHARIVIDHAIRRQVIADGGKVSRAAERGQADPAELSRDLLLAGEVAAKRIGGGNRTYAPEQVASDALAWVSAVQDGSKQGILTGFPAWDLTGNGLQDGELILLAARPSVGKTSLALDVARSALSQGHGVLFFSYEMDRIQLQLRMISADSGIPLWKMRRKKGLDTAAQELFAETEKRYAEMPLRVNEGPATPEDMHEVVAQELAKHKDIRLVIIDYIQLMDTRIKQRGANRQEVVASISRSLKSLAMEFHLPVLALSQLSRLGEHQQREPQLADLRDSGALEQDADVVLFLHRQKIPAPENHFVGKIDLIIRKNRQGPLGRIPLLFHATRTTFEQAENGNNGREEWWRGESVKP